jgi:hypothetical protein
MAKSKYARNIITEDLMPPPPAGALELMEEQRKAGRTIDRTLLLGMQDSILKGSFFAGCEWIWGLTGNGPVNTELPHKHDFDEIIGFAGSNRNHPRDLGGEIITRTCLIFIPRGVEHCPIIFRKVDTPIFMFEAGNSASYEKII